MTRGGGRKKRPAPSDSTRSDRRRRQKAADPAAHELALRKRREKEQAERDARRRQESVSAPAAPTAPTDPTAPPANAENSTRAGRSRKRKASGNAPPVDSGRAAMPASMPPHSSLPAAPAPAPPADTEDASDNEQEDGGGVDGVLHDIAIDMFGGGNGSGFLGNSSAAASEAELVQPPDRMTRHMNLKITRERRKLKAKAMCVQRRIPTLQMWRAPRMKPARIQLDRRPAAPRESEAVVVQAAQAVPRIPWSSPTMHSHCNFK